MLVTYIKNCQPAQDDSISMLMSHVRYLFQLSTTLSAGTQKHTPTLPQEQINALQQEFELRQLHINELLKDKPFSYCLQIYMSLLFGGLDHIIKLRPNNLPLQGLYRDMLHLAAHRTRLLTQPESDPSNPHEASLTLARAQVAALFKNRSTDPEWFFLIPSIIMQLEAATDSFDQRILERAKETLLRNPPEVTLEMLGTCLHKLHILRQGECPPSSPKEPLQDDEALQRLAATYTDWIKEVCVLLLRNSIVLTDSQATLIFRSLCTQKSLQVIKLTGEHILIAQETLYYKRPFSDAETQLMIFQKIRAAIAQANEAVRPATATKQKEDSLGLLKFVTKKAAITTELTRQSAAQRAHETSVMTQSDVLPMLGPNSKETPEMNTEVQYDLFMPTSTDQPAVITPQRELAIIPAEGDRLLSSAKKMPMQKDTEHRRKRRKIR